MGLEGALFLRFDKPVAPLDRVELIGADTPEQNFLAAGLGVEVRSTSRSGRAAPAAATIHVPPGASLDSQFGTNSPSPCVHRGGPVRGRNARL